MAEAKTKIQAELQQNPSSVEGYNSWELPSATKGLRKRPASFQHALKLDPSSATTQRHRQFLLRAGKTRSSREGAHRFSSRARQSRCELQRGPGPHGQEFTRRSDSSLSTRPTSGQRHSFQFGSRLPSRRQNCRRAEAGHGDLPRSKDDVKLHFTLGVLLASEKQYRPAQLELEKADALSLKRWRFSTLWTRHLRGGDYAKAELMANRAVKLKPDSPETLYLLAQVYQKQNRSVDALDLLVCP